MRKILLLLPPAPGPAPDAPPSDDLVRFRFRADLAERMTADYGVFAGLMD